MTIMVDLHEVRVRKAMNTAGSGVTIACSKCGHSNSGRARFCEKCAAPMGLSEDQPTIANTRLASPLQLGDADEEPPRRSLKKRANGTPPNLGAAASSAIRTTLCCYDA